MPTPLSVLVMFSGRGSNFEALVKAQGAFRVCGAICDNPEAGGIAVAEQASIPVKLCCRKDYASLQDFKRGLLHCADSFSPDLVALAGFMRILDPHFVNHFSGKLINIHPSLLPSYPGLDTHERAIKDGVKQHGCTVHYVDSGVDTGPIIAQAEVECEDHDTCDSLSARVLKREHAIYPWVIQCIAGGEIGLSGRQVTYSDRARSEALQLGFKLAN